MFFLQLSDIIDSWVQSHITVIEKKIIVFQQNYKKLSKKLFVGANYINKNLAHEVSTTS